MPPVTTVTYVPNPLAMEALSMTSQVLIGCLEMGEWLATLVRIMTPVRISEPTGEDDSAEQGAFRESIIVRPIAVFPQTYLPGPSSLAPFLGGHNNSGARVVAMDPRFHWLEFGTAERETDEGAERGEESPHAPFRRAAEQTGIRYIPYIRSNATR